MKHLQDRYHTDWKLHAMLDGVGKESFNNQVEIKLFNEMYALLRLNLVKPMYEYVYESVMHRMNNN